MDKNLESRDNSRNTVSTISNNAKELNSIERILIAVLRRKKIFLITIISFLVFGYIRTTRELIFNSLYQGSFTLLIKDPINNSSNGEEVKSMFDLDNSVDQDIPTLRKLLLSEFILKDISEKFSLIPENLADRIKIEEDYKAVGVLDVYLTSSSPKSDEALLKELSNLYVNYASMQKQKKLSDGLSFLSAQEPAIREKNLILKDELEKFRNKNNVVDPVFQAQKKKDEIGSLKGEIRDLKQNTERLLKIKNEVSKGELNTSEFKEDISSKLGSSFKIENPEQQLANQYESLNKELANALLTYTPSSSMVRNIKGRIDDLKPLIKESQLKTIDKAIKTNRENINLNEARIIKLNDEFNKYNSSIKEFLVLEFELNASKNNLAGISRVKDRLQYDLAQDSKPWTIIKQPSFKTNRVYPSFKKELINFALLGAFVGAILALLRDKFDYVYHSPKEIETELKVPSLGHIPYVEFFADIREQKKSILDSLTDKPDANGQNINSYDKFFYQEAFRNIYTSIRFTNSDRPLQIVTLTSSIPKEGKSLTNILLAKTLSEMDLKILLIDADLRKPQLHYRLGLNNITGLSNILTDKKIKYSEGIQKVPGYKNWDVITSGTKPPDPTRLFKSESMSNFIDELKKDNKYDLVLIDTPPVIGLADSLLVSEKSDGLILIVSTNNVPRDMPKESINRVLDSGAYFIGMITNSTKKSPSKLLDSYAYGSYSYTYNAYLDNDENSIKDIKEQSKFEKIRDTYFKNIREVISKIFIWLDN